VIPTEAQRPPVASSSSPVEAFRAADRTFKFF
jgi:hypothetical protein